MWSTMVFAVVGGYISLENVAPLLCKIFIMREFAFILSISSRNLPVSECTRRRLSAYVQVNSNRCGAGYKLFYAIAVVRFEVYKNLRPFYR